MAQQTILFTVMPRAIQVNPTTCAVSVLVSPRLQGSTRLGEFPDWLNWTQKLKDQGLKLTFRCQGDTLDLNIAAEPLRPALWREMFNEDTFVRPHSFDDYSERTVFSYPVRLALSTLKSIYQQAGVTLGLPDRTPADIEGRQEAANRRFIRSLLSGLEVNWSEERGERLRDTYRSGFALFRSAARFRPPRFYLEQLNEDGTLKNVPAAGTTAAKNLKQFVATQFAVYSHMPQGAPVAENPPDFDELIDFHQALSSLNTYPRLLRALGLVFDFQLPVDFVAETALTTPGRLAVVDLPGQSWEIQTLTVPNLSPLETAYLYFSAGGPDPWKVFTTAPGILGAGLTDLEVFGLLNLDPARYGLAQVDVESGMHKTILLAESWQADRPAMSAPDHPEVFDETTTLPSLRSGGFSLFADGRALGLLHRLSENRQFNQQLESSSALARPFFIEDLVQGYRMDIWDSATLAWHSLHLRDAVYQIGEQTFNSLHEEGFVELAAGQAAPDPENPPPDDLYLNESVARWAGWSLSVPFPGKTLSRDPDPDKALEEDPAHPPNEPATPFKMTTHYTAVRGSLPALRFGHRYRLRLRAVDLCGNSLEHDSPLAALLANLAGLPRSLEGIPYLRFEPVAPPQVVLRDTRAVTEPGSQLERLVIRTYNSDPSQDTAPADLTASDRFIVPPSTSVETGERLGMFDDASGKLVNSPAMYQLIGERDQGRLNHVEVEVAGQMQQFPLQGEETLDTLPYLPDVLARGAALRDLPGAPEGSLASVEPGPGAEAPVAYEPLSSANPRAGSATLVSFGGEGDWQQLRPFRLALADGEQTPHWDPQNRVLTVYLPKAAQTVVPLSSFLFADDLKRMGVWQWLREYIDQITVQQPESPVANPELDSEKIAHLLQRALEGGHWMITPPRLLTLVHAVQQPVGRPVFTAISVQHKPYGSLAPWGSVDEKYHPDPSVLQTVPESSPTAGGELDIITAWRKPDSPESYLLGGLKLHAASTGKLDLLAEWSDPLDDISQPRQADQEYRQHNTALVEEIPVPGAAEGYIATGEGTSNYRRLAYYDADHDLLCFVRDGDQLGNLKSGVVIAGNAAPRHFFNDTKYHRVHYHARAVSRFQEYFPQDQELDFTRTSPVVSVHVPASSRPAPPFVDYVIPTFGWQRQTETNMKRSVRFGGGLRVYLDRPWFSSGEGEMLGVVLYDYSNGSLDDRERWKPYITQWGGDPIWQTDRVTGVPLAYQFPTATVVEDRLSLPGRAPGCVVAAAFPVSFDEDRQKWFCDLVIDSPAYNTFIRLALARYQPCALPDAKLSPVVLADYAQLTPERSAVLTADPYHPRRLRLTISGPAPTGPVPDLSVHPPTQVTVTLQQRIPDIPTDLGWEDAPEEAAAIQPQPFSDPGGLVRWTGTVNLASLPDPGQYRLLICEYEVFSPSRSTSTGEGDGRTRAQPRRLIYAETIEIDSALIGSPTSSTGTVVDAG